MMFNLVLFMSLIYLLRVNFIGSINSHQLYVYTSKFFVTSMLFYLFLTLTVLNYLLDGYSEISNISLSSITCLTPFSPSKLLFSNTMSLHLLEVYLYPFIYVFLVVTVLSIVFCLTYNQDELSTFMFYCLNILLSGYFLFFTDSMITFFFAYEMLLVPSFFILYKFAKTRRCVEAAYLMFF